MGPTKVLVKDGGLYDAVSGKLVKDGFANRREMEDYVNHHYLVLPVIDNAGRPWQLDGKPVYCLHGVQYETVDDQKFTSPAARSAAAWGYVPTNLRWNRIASGVQSAETSSIPGSK